jgi:hypothetical protein
MTFLHKGAMIYMRMRQIRVIGAATILSTCMPVVTLKYTMLSHEFM